MLAKLAYEAGSQPVPLFAARVDVAALLLAVVGARRRAICEAGIEARHIALGGLGGAAFAGAGMAEFEALSRAPAATVVLLVFVAPVWVALASWMLWRTAIGWIRCGLFALVLAGTGLLVATPDRHQLDDHAVALALVASVLSATFFLIMARLVADMRPRRASCLLAIGAALCTTLVSAQAAAGELSSFPRAWYAISIGAITALALGLLCAGMGQTSVLSGSAIVGAEPVVAAVLSWLVLGEVLTTLQLVGATGVLLGVTMLSVRSLGLAHLASASPLVEPHGCDEDDSHDDVLPEPLDATDQQTVG